MHGSGKPTRAFAVDSNVYVAAITQPSPAKPSFRLLISLTRMEDARLVTTALIIDEMVRYSMLLRSQTARSLLSALLARSEVIEVEERFVEACGSLMAEAGPADILLAATALKTGAVVISNDRHFRKLKESNIVQVWSIAEAIDRLGVL